MAKEVKLMKLEDKNDKLFQTFLVVLAETDKNSFNDFKKALKIRSKNTNEIVNKIIEDFAYDDLFPIMDDLGISKKFFLKLDLYYIDSEYFNTFRKIASRRDLGIAKKQAQYATWYIMGSYNNSESEMPEFADLVEEIYKFVINNTFRNQCDYITGPKKEIRFVGKEFLIEFIREFVEEEEMC